MKNRGNAGFRYPVSGFVFCRILCEPFRMNGRTGCSDMPFVFHPMDESKKTSHQ